MNTPSAMPSGNSIPYLLEGRDLLVASQTGTGKTGASRLPFVIST